MRITKLFQNRTKLSQLTGIKIVFSIPIAVLFSISPEAHDILEIQAELGRDSKTGFVHGHAEGVILAKPETVYQVLSVAIHGKLSKRTKVCLAFPKEKAEGYLTRPVEERLGIRGKASDALKKEVLENAGGELTEGVVPRIDVMYTYRFMEMPPFVPNQWFVTRETHDASKAAEGIFSIRMEAILGNIKHYDSRWIVTPLEGGSKTKVQMINDTDTGFSGPEFLLKLGKSELRHAVEQVRKLVAESASTPTAQSTPTEK